MIDYLIIGQGIAGSVLAWQLSQAGNTVFVMNNPSTNQASQIAAGLYNPITGRHLAKTWLADQLFPAMEQFYTAVEDALQVKLLHPHLIFRPFLNLQEQTDYLNKNLVNEHNPYIDLVKADYPVTNFYNLYGGLMIKQAGYLDVPCFLAAIRNYLEKRGCYQVCEFVYHQLRLGTYVQYQDIQAKNIIFCEGAQAKKNPFFSFLPFRLVKGELLTIGLAQELDIIYNRGIYIVPKPGKQAIVGPTYDWQDLTLDLTIKARIMLDQALQERFQLPYVILNQKAGIRPATFDRRPFIGTHPDYPSMHIFNGLGTKGVSLSPYLAEQFVAHLLEKKDLLDEVRLSRGNK